MLNRAVIRLLDGLLRTRNIKHFNYGIIRVRCKKGEPLEREMHLSVQGMKQANPWSHTHPTVNYGSSIVESLDLGNLVAMCR